MVVEESANGGGPERDQQAAAERERLLRLALIGTRASVSRAQTVGPRVEAWRFSDGDSTRGLGGGGGGKGGATAEHDSGNSENESSMMRETHSSSSTS